LLASAAWARPPHATTGQPTMPLRVVMQTHGARLSNCVFATQPIPPRAHALTPLQTSFSEGDGMFARCYLPDPPGANKPGELIDTFFLDGKKWWTQAYDAAVPADALERPIVLGEVLRSALQTVPKGTHLVEIRGTLKRGGKIVKLYQGEFRYVR
jgi:hypothetical protein